VGPVNVTAVVVPVDVVTVNEAVLAPVPDGVATAIGPVVAPVGTVAVIWVAELTANAVAAVPLKVTLVAPVKLVPLMVTGLPVGPEGRVNEEIVGAAAVVVTVNEAVLVPV